MGTRRWLWTLGSPMGDPYSTMLRSSRLASPSIDSLSFSSRYSVCPVKNSLNCWNLRISSRLLPWCDVGWNGRSSPLSGYTRLVASRDSLRVKTRVMSVWKASTCRSNMSCKCSVKESGTPAGASGRARSSPLAFCSSII